MDIKDFLAKRDAKKQSKFIKFKNDGEVKYLRFLDPDIESVRHLKSYNKEVGKYLYDSDIPKDTADRVSLVLRLNVIEYDADGSNPTRRVWEFSDYLYQKYAQIYMTEVGYENISDVVWKVRANTPTEMTASYAFIRTGYTEEQFPIIEEEEKEEVSVKETPTVKTESPKKEIKRAVEVPLNRYFE